MLPIFDAHKRLTVDSLMFGGATIAGMRRPVLGADARGALQTAVDAGVKHYDTAPYYGFGISEEHFGSVLANNQDVVIDTKCGWTVLPLEPPVKSKKWFGEGQITDRTAVRRYDRQSILEGWSDSVERLGGHSIRAFRLHTVNKDYINKTRDTIKAMLLLKEEGKIEEISLGVQGLAARDYIVAHPGVFDSALIAGQFNLLQMAPNDRRGIETCIKENVAIDLASPFARGTLFHPGKLKKPERMRYNKWIGLAKKYNVDVQALALWFANSVRGVRSVCFGSRNQQQTQDVIHWCKQAEPLGREMWGEVIAAGLVNKRDVNL